MVRQGPQILHLQPDQYVWSMTDRLAYLESRHQGLWTFREEICQERVLRQRDWWKSAVLFCPQKSAIVLVNIEAS